MLPVLWLQSLLNRGAPLVPVRSNPGRPVNLLQHAAEFQRHLTGEQLRADRCGSEMAILVFPAAEGSEPFSNRSQLGDSLGRRLRRTDAAGLLADGSLALLLPNTGRAGAHKVAGDVGHLLGPPTEQPACQVFLYPDPATEADPPACLVASCS